MFDGFGFISIPVGIYIKNEVECDVNENVAMVSNIMAEQNEEEKKYSHNIEAHTF